MPPRDDELPEGTDHIINGAMETGGGEAGSGAAGGGSSSGFIGASGGDGTGGTAASGGGTDMTTRDAPGHGGSNRDGPGIGGSNLTAGDSGAEGGGVGEQIKGQIYNLRDQAGGKVRNFAEDGKTRATDVLEELSRVVADTADSIDERLGNNYGEYARKAADSVAGLADNLRSRDVDELYDNVRSAVRKSPGVAIGIAAVVGFTLVRLIKAGLPEETEGTGDTNRRRTNSGGTGA
ncbi:MAG TPA: hypothetical protein VFQ67_06450 [Allosphingosinicella sp.]|jgi:ElaB/YqjD/DUF883 family membrane-anchored ribosome-binding protein|nr:hypothetical protein [Allosphingosinicella sp.]